ncbi:hypothetical protein ACOSP7_006329 [Xanthoceras sorbifolium]
MSRVRMSYFFLITILLVLMAQTQTAFAVDFNPKVTVSVTNELSNNAIPLFMHCWSHNDDLGVHTLWKTNEWHWEFRNDFLRRTHFLCNFRHGTREKTIDVYDKNNRKLRCFETRHCNWFVKDDGFYFFNEDQHKLLKYNDW